MKSNVIKNFVYQFLYQILILVIPFIVSPHLTRTLSEKALGEYTYINSFAYYFVLLAMLGILRHGQRVISREAGSTEKLRKVFWGLCCAHMISSILALVLYISLIFAFNNQNNALYTIQIIYVLSAMFDITWLFYGLENFRSVVIKNAFIRVSECVMILIFIRTPDDIYLYALITSLSILIGQVMMIPQAVKMVPPIKVSWQDIAVHFKPLLIFSISVIAVSMYTVFDKILLGLLMEKENVAYYEYANKVISIPKTIITVIGTVMYPRACSMIADGNHAGQKIYMKYSFVLTAFIGIGSAFGLIGVSREFSRYYYGEGFLKSGYVMRAMAFLPYIIGTGDVIRTQYMIPNHLDKEFNLCIILNAVINIVTTLTAIPVYGIYGAVIGTTCAESFGLCFQIYICRDKIYIKDIFNPVIPLFFSGFIMLVTIQIIAFIFGRSLQSLLLQCLSGAVIYSLLSLPYLKNIYRKRIG